MRICLIAGDLDWSREGGGETYFSYLGRLLSARHDVTVWCLQRPPAGSSFPFEIVAPDEPPPSPPPVPESLEPIVHAFARCNWVAQSLAGRAFDVIESPDYAAWSALLRPLFEAHDVRCDRFAVSLHGVLSRSFTLDWLQRFSPVVYEQTRALEHLLIASADVRIAMGRAYARQWARRVGRPVSMILPVTPFIEQPLRPGVECTPPDLCAIARMQRWKGLEVFATALAEVPTKSYGRVLFIGRDQRIDAERSASDVLAGILRRSSISTAEFRGSLSRSELVATLCTRPVCVFPSIWDTLNLTALEAVLCGCPVVVSRACGIAEFFEQAPEEIRPVFAEPDSPSELGRAIAELLGNIGEARRRAGRLGEWIRGFLSAESVTSSIERAYEAASTPVREHPQLTALCAIGRSFAETGVAGRVDSANGYEVELMRNLTNIARDYERAMSLYEARWQTFAGSAEGHYLYGVCLFEHRRNYPGAIHHFTRAVEIGGFDEFSVLWRRGQSHFSAGNLQQARDDLARAHWLNPANAAVREMLERCLERVYA